MMRKCPLRDQLLQYTSKQSIDFVTLLNIMLSYLYQNVVSTDYITNKHTNTQTHTREITHNKI